MATTFHLGNDVVNYTLRIFAIHECSLEYLSLATQLSHPTSSKPCEYMIPLIQRH